MKIIWHFSLDPIFMPFGVSLKMFMSYVEVILWINCSLLRKKRNLASFIKHAAGEHFRGALA